MKASLEHSTAFDLPSTVSEWFRARFAIPDTVYSLAVIYLWIYSTRQSTENGKREFVVAARQSADHVVWLLSRRLHDGTDSAVEVRRLRNVLGRAADMTAGV